MANVIWNVFDNVEKLLKGQPGEAEIVKADAILDAVMESIADVLPTATHAVLEEGALAARSLLQTSLRPAGADDRSISYIAGRLSAIVDVLAHAARQTVDEARIQVVRRQPYVRVLAALDERPLRNVDLVAVLEKDKAQVSKWLETLRDAGVVVSQKQGRETVNALTPLGRSIVMEGIQNERRVPIQQANVHDFNAGRDFNLSHFSDPTMVTGRGERLPILNAAVR